MKRKWFSFSYYNIKNKPEDSYDKEYNEVYQTNKDKYFKIVINWWWNVPHIPFEGINFAHMWNVTQLVFSGTKNNYWLILRDSPRYSEKAKWKIRMFKSTNDHVGCG